MNCIRKIFGLRGPHTSSLISEFRGSKQARQVLPRKSFSCRHITNKCHSQAYPKKSTQNKKAHHSFPTLLSIDVDGVFAKSWHSSPMPITPHLARLGRL